MGHGGGQTLLARDEHDPNAPLVRRRIVRTYERTAYHLQVLTLADADGRRQTLRVTDEHPFYRTAPAAGGSAGAPGWTPARSLAAGDEVLGDCGVLTVIANAGEAHRQGVKVYNLEVEQAHTYFVLAEHAPDGADAVWVHNTYELDPQRSVRKQLYPTRARKSTMRDLEVGATNADGQIVCQNADCTNGVNGNRKVLAPGEGTPEHIPPLVETHNAIGYNTDQPTRNNLYNSTALQLFCETCQKQQGGRTTTEYTRILGPNFAPTRKPRG